MVSRKIPNWYVITGVPSSGITTLGTALQTYVDKVFPEAARVHIDNNLKKGISVAKTRADEGKFQKRVLKMKLRREARARKDKTYILERGVPDSIPYFTVAGLDPSPIKTYSKNRYRLVFFLEPLPYKKDYARTETEKTRNKLNDLLFETYKDLGYRVIRVPAAPVSDRVKIVLPFLSKNLSTKSKLILNKK